MEYEPVRIPVTYGTLTCGELLLLRDGLYTNAQCRCRHVSQSVLRAYVRCAEETICLGVVAPDAGELFLQRRIPASRLDPQRAGEAYLSDGEQTPWQPWQGEIEGCQLTGVSRICDGEQTIAVAYNPSEPLPCLRLYATLTPMWLDGKLYLTL